MNHKAMPKIQNSFLLFALIIGALFLQACDTGGGYSSRSGGWNNQSPSAQSPASQAPSTIGEQTPSTPQTQEQIARDDNLPAVKVGILLPLSGQHEKLGKAMLDAAQIALFDVGHSSFELIPRDTLGTPEGASQAASAAINEGAQLILGPVFAENVRVVKPITQRANINMIGFSTDWTLAGGNTFIMGFLPFDQVERITQYASQQGIKRVGVLAPNTDYGRIVQSTFSTMAPRYGIATTQSASFSPQSTNLAPDVKEFSRYDTRLASNALAQTPYDAILMPTGGQQASAIASLLSLNDLPPAKVRRIGTGMFDDAALATESNLEGAWFAAPSPNARRNFETRFTRTYGTRPPRISTLAYDATALAAVLARKGLTEQRRPAFDRGSITNPNGFSGIDGIFRFRQNGTAERGLAVLEYKRGQIVVIDEAPTTFAR